MASVTKRSTSKGIRYDVRYRTPSGAVRNKTLRTRRDAERFANTVEADLLRGHWVDPRAGRVSFEQYADEWLAHKTNLRPRTRELYAHQLRAHVYPDARRDRAGEAVAEDGARVALGSDCRNRARREHRG